MRVGAVREIWRYPVKSMGGEPLSACTPLPRVGIPGDRGWAVRDEEIGEIRSAKKIPDLIRCRARYLEEPQGTAVPPAEITLPDGTAIRTDDADASARVSQLTGRALTLCSRRPAEDLDHYRRKQVITDVEREIREASALLPEEPLPDLSEVDPTLFEFVSPPGTYFDAFELHLLTTASLEELARLAPASRIDVRRFRPNLLVEPTGGRHGFPEIDWCKREIRIGAARLRVIMPVMRCAMTTWAQGDLPKDPSIMRPIVRHMQQNLGIGLSVIESGSIRIGDPVELL